jgi:hypothetical protein
MYSHLRAIGTFPDDDRLEAQEKGEACFVQIGDERRKMVDGIYLHDQDTSQYRAGFGETAVQTTSRSTMADATTDESQWATKIEDVQPVLFCPNCIMNAKKLAIKMRRDCELLAFD